MTVKDRLAVADRPFVFSSKEAADAYLQKREQELKAIREEARRNR